MRSLSLIGGDLTMELLKIKCEDEYDPLIRQVCEEINKKND
jgi:hypothetical protein